MLMCIYKTLSTFDVFVTTIWKEENQPQTIFYLVPILVISEKQLHKFPLNDASVTLKGTSLILLHI